MAGFIFVRHGQSEANASKQIADDTTKLTALGREQSRQVAVELKPLSIAKILSSPATRARQTAQIISDELGLDKPQVINELAERNFASLKGKPRQFESKFYDTVMEYKDIETADELISRMRTALKKIARIVQRTDGVVLAVGHGSSGYCLRELAKGKKSYQDFEYSNVLNAGFTKVMIHD